MPWLLERTRKLPNVVSVGSSSSSRVASVTSSAPPSRNSSEAAVSSSTSAVLPVSRVASRGRRRPPFLVGQARRLEAL